MKIIANLDFNWWTKGDKELRTKSLIDEAKRTGADAVCLPYFRADKVHRVPNALKQFRKFDTPDSVLDTAIAVADDHGLELIVTVHDHESVDFLRKLGIIQFHIPNGCLEYWPLLNNLAGEQVLLSTGYGTFSEVDEALAVLCPEDDYHSAGSDNVILLHSTGAMPTPAKEAQLMRILDLQTEFFPLYVGLESFYYDRLLDFVAMAFKPAVIMRVLDLNDQEGVSTPYSIYPSELETLSGIAKSMVSVSNPVYYAESFTEGDWEARVNKWRCQSADYTLPPEG